MNPDGFPIVDPGFAFVVAWSSAMLRACWQGGAAIALAWLVCRALPKMAPSVRCWLWRLAYLKLLVALVWSSTIELPLLPPPSARPVRETVPLPHDRIKALSPAPQSPPAKTNLPPPPGRIPYAAGALMMSWLLVLPVLVARFVRECRAIRRLRRSCRRVDDAVVIASVDALCGQLRLRTRPPLLQSDALESPVVIGLWRPTIIVPSSLFLVGGESPPTSPDELRLLLAHELAHMNRRDLVWGLLPALAQALFFFHPLVWLAWREWKLAHESACDELALLITNASIADYGSVLLKVATSGRNARPTSSWVAVGVVESHQSLKRRIVMMEHVGQVTRRSLKVTGALVMVIGVIGMVPWRVTAQERKPSSLRSTIAGRVVDETSKPIAGVKVHAFDAEWRKEKLLATKTTGKDGAFAFDGLTFPANYPVCTLICLHPDYAVGGLRSVPSLMAGETITLRRPTTLEGIVMNRDSELLEGATVILRHIGGFTEVLVPQIWKERFTFRTDKEGRFRAVNLPRGSEAQFAVQHPGYEDFSQLLVLSKSASTGPLKIQLGPSSEIQGRVTFDDTGQPATGIRLGCQPQGQYPKNHPGWGEAVTDDNGNYRLTGLAAATWNVIVDLDDKMADEWTAAAAEGVKLTQGQTVRGIDLRLIKGGVIVITAADAETGKPIPKVNMGCYCPARPSTSAWVLSVTTDDDGRARLRVPPGSTRVYHMSRVEDYVVNPGQDGQEVDVVAGQTREVTFALKKGGLIEGTVVDEKGRPVPRASVWNPTGSANTATQSLVRTDALGKFRMSGLALPAVLNLRAATKELGMREPLRVQLTVQNRRETVSLKVIPFPNASLAGKVVDSDGKPIAGAIVEQLPGANQG